MPDHTAPPRRTLAMILAGARPKTRILRAQDGTPVSIHDWTPPPIPEPLPSPGGEPVEIVGRAVERPAPTSGAPTSIEQPAAAGTPLVGSPAAGETVSGEIPVTNPQQPAQPLATPVTTEELADDEIIAATVVTMTPDFRFDPPEVRISAGEAVEWRNAGRSPQTVTGDPAFIRDDALVSLPDGAEAWDSGVVNSGQTALQVFEVPGEYRYASMPNAERGMSGIVIVEPAE
jgi:plastocyanin